MSPNHINNTSEEATTRKFEPGESVIVERNVRDEKGEITGTVPELGWKVVGEITSGDDAGKILVRNESETHDKSISPRKLDRIQKSYQLPEQGVIGGEGFSTSERRDVGGSSLAVAEVANPDPDAPAPFSEGWREYMDAKRREEAIVNPTIDNPSLFDTPRPATLAGGYEVDVIGMYADDQGNGLVVRDPLDGEISYHRPAEVTMLLDKPSRATASQVTDETQPRVNVPTTVEPSSSAAGVERQPVDAYEYLKELLPPVTRPAGEAPRLDYSYIHIKDALEQGRAAAQAQAELAHKENTPEGKARKYYDKVVTEENRQDSLDFLGEVIKANPELVTIFQEAGLNPSDVATVDAIRENTNIRFQVAKHIAKKLDRLVTDDPEGFGLRVAQNSSGNLKVDTQTGKTMHSRDYAVSLALKMIDGEFSKKLESNDFARDGNGRVAIGQHRHAARAVLMSRY